MQQRTLSSPGADSKEEHLWAYFEQILATLREIFTCTPWFWLLIVARREMNMILDNNLLIK